MVVNGTKQGLKTISHSNPCGMGIEPPIDGDHRAGVSYRTMPLSHIVCPPETAHGDCSPGFWEGSYLGWGDYAPDGGCISSVLLT